MIELLKRWSEEEPERCKQNEMRNIFHLSYNLQNGHYIDTDHLTNEILAIIQRCVQNAIIARKWPFDLSFGSYGYKAWIQAEFGNPAYAESADIVECLLSAYVKALKANKPTRFEGVVSIENGFANIVRDGKGYSVPIKPTKITRRMKQIIKMMQENGAVIQESRDAFLERSSYAVEWKSEDGLYHSIDIKERTLEKLEDAGLVRIAENNPVYDKGGKFITSEAVYELIAEGEAIE